VQLERLPEQWQHFGLLPFLEPGILKCTLTDAVAHESIPPDLLPRLIQGENEDETMLARHDSLGQATTDRVTGRSSAIAASPRTG